MEEIPVEPVKSENVSRKTVIPENTLANIDINSIIREAVETEINNHGINFNTIKTQSSMKQSNSNTINPLVEINSNGIDDSRATHFIAENGNNGLNRSREHNCPDPTALAKQTQIALEQDNFHSIRLSLGLRYYATTR